MKSTLVALGLKLKLTVKSVKLVTQSSRRFIKKNLKSYFRSLSRLLRGRKTTQKASDLAFLSVTGLITQVLKDLAKQPDAMTHPDGMQIKITRQEIGRIAVCSREMAGRVIKELESHGLISVAGKTMVLLGA